MPQQVKILNAKLLQPRISNIIYRKRLYPILSKIKEKRLTVVTAGAGFGKTTLISEACTYLGIDTVWYRLDRSDRDYITFLSYLIAGIKKHYSQFGVETIQCMNEADISDQSGQEAILTRFLMELEAHIKKDIIIVLDDYQSLQNSLKIDNSLKFFLQHLPSTVHLVIISRTTPGINLSRFRSQQHILDISDKNLIFNRSETKELYSGCLKLALESESLEILHDKTHGWAAGLILLYNSLINKAPEEMKPFLVALKGTHKEISSYLGENVFDLQPDEYKHFLIQTSVLSRMNPDFCDELLHINNSHDIFNNLEENHLFTFPFDEQGEWYYYHHLFQDFLSTKIRKEMDHETYRQLNIRAALLWEKLGDQGESLRHYILAKEFDPACRLLGNIGKTYIEQGRIQLFNSYFDAIPDTYLKKYPWVQYTKARALDRSGNLVTAIQVYKKAHKIFKMHNDELSASLCLSSLGSMYYQIGDFTQAEKRLSELLDQIVDNPRLRLDILGSLIFITSHQGKMDIADKYIDEAQSILSKVHSPRLLAWFYFYKGFRYSFSGDFIITLKFGKQTKEMCENSKLYRLLAYNYHSIAWSCYYLGRFAEGMENAEKGLELIKERGYQDSSRAWVLADYALNAVALGKIKRAFQAAKQSLAIFQSQESVWGQVWAYHVLHEIHFTSGEMQKSEESVRIGLDLLKSTRLPLHEGILKLRLAKCLLAQNQKQGVADLLVDAKRCFKHSKMFIALADLMFAKLYWDQQQDDRAIEFLRSGLDTCRINQYNIWVLAEKEWIAPILVESYIQGRMKDYILVLFQQIDAFGREAALLHIGKNPSKKVRRAVSELLGNLKTGPPPDLNVCCFGKFRIFQNEIEIPDTGWKSKKAKNIFKYLVYMRDRGYVDKDVLMELVWPDEASEKITSRLHDALTSLRKTLEPHLQRGFSSAYLLRDGSAYRLYLGENGGTDVDAFQHELKLAEKEKRSESVIRHYLRAENIYQGDFLEEDAYAEWCMEERRCLKEKYLGLLENIIHYFDTHHTYNQCIEYANKYLKHDRYAEHIYRKLMKYYALVDNMPLITKTFKRCKENMMDGCDACVSRETETLYAQLMKNGKQK